MKKYKALLYMTVLSLVLNVAPVSFAHGQEAKESKEAVKVEAMSEERYHDGRFPGFSPDFKYLDKAKRERAGSMTVVHIKNGKIDNMRVRNLKGKALQRNNYPEYIKAYEDEIIKKGVDNVGELEGYEEEGKIIRALVKDALERSKGYEKEFRSTYQKADTLKEGTYFGTHQGFYPDEKFLVKVVVKDNMIDSVEVMNHADDDYIREEKYFGNGKFFENLKGKADAGADVVSGATFSTKGIQQAIENALVQAQGYVDGRFPGFSADYKNVNKSKEVSTVAVKDGYFQRNGTFCMVNVKEGKIDSVSVRVVDGKIIDRKNYTDETKYLVELQKEIKEKGLENVKPVKGHEKESELIFVAVADALTRSAKFEKEFELMLDKDKSLKLGVYEGSHNGFYPMEQFKVKVEVRNGKIHKMDIIGDADDNYIRVDKNAKSETAKKFKEMVNSYVGRSDVNVDVVTGATFSSKGVQKAVEDALKKAQ